MRRRAFRILAAYGTSPDLLESLQRTRISLDGTLVGRVCKEGQPRSVPDLERAPLDPHLQRLHEAGWRSVLAVPMLQEGVIVGALVVRRRTSGDFSQDTAELLQTFASQSALAIVNARLFRELERKTGELQVASRHKSEFLASMSHELRTPLNAVIGFSEVLLQRMFGDLNERQDDYLRDILGSGRHLLELLNDILDLSKVEAGRMELDPSTFSVQAALDYSLAMVRERAATHAITLDLDVDPAIGDIETDELRFKQVVLNLVSNAVKFSADGGRVSVRAVLRGQRAARHRHRQRDRCRARGPGAHLRVLPAGRPRPRSERGDRPGADALPTHRRAVRRPDVARQRGRGGQHVRLLRARGRGRGHRGAEAFDDTGAGPLVVVVEDDRRSLELISLYLDGAGVQTVAARDGAEGLAAVRRHHPAAVVLDIRLPGMDGWRVLEALKADPATAAAPVVVVTMLDERPQALALGAAEYLVKPVGRDDVLGALQPCRCAASRSH